MKTFTLFRMLCLVLCLLAGRDSFAKDVGKALDASGESDSKRVAFNSDIITEFHPHLTMNAKTREKGSLYFQRSSGANLNTSFLLSSLTYSFHPRFEVGTAPLMYIVDEHLMNGFVKYNFYRSKKTNVALSFSTAIFDVPDSLGQFVMSALQLGWNQELTEWGSFFSISLSSIVSYVKSDTEPDPLIYSFDRATEWAVDYQVPLSETYQVTFGLGTLREAGITAYETTYFGFGASVTRTWSDRFFSSLTLGVHYTPDLEDVIPTLSFEIR